MILLYFTISLVFSSELSWIELGEPLSTTKKEINGISYFIFHHYPGLKKTKPIVGYDYKGVYLRDARVCTWKEQNGNKEITKKTECKDGFPFELIKNNSGKVLVNFFISDQLINTSWTESSYRDSFNTSFDSEIHVDKRDFSQAIFRISDNLKKQRIQMAMDSGLKEQIECWLKDDACGLNDESIKICSSPNVIKKVLSIILNSDENFKFTDNILNGSSLSFLIDVENSKSRFTFSASEYEGTIQWHLNEECGC